MTAPPDLPARRHASLVFRDGRFEAGARAVPEEVAVAISIDGSTHAVMMASPRDLVDLGLGLALNERIVADRSEIERIEIVETELGFDCQIRLAPARGATYVARRRQMAGPVGCGLCGVESLELAAPPLPVLSAEMRVPPAALVEAVAAMGRAQRLGQETRAVHAAGFFVPGEGLLVLREDVGRHNALDKVAGRLAEQGVPAAGGIVAITSRVSVELVQKCAVMGVPVLVAVSVPTALALDQADACGLTLVAVARGGEFEVFTHPRRILGAAAKDGETRDAG
ncbi:sulfurtransferase FdhD [Aureimonas endophytica]|uniref:Sulfur carrier protein FdhD n=1 Tax=Aureimonas endophytica TaxID=2027858 RepID=A0A917E9F6_9HYPH|nr:formate dehydrogenase accessory sulfurtransferase FdhD [Aureimonas endophytica]GGE13743.1 sulfurtransferase FdhD [Aureimonas endophytica]